MPIFLFSYNNPIFSILIQIKKYQALYTQEVIVTKGFTRARKYVLGTAVNTMPVLLYSGF